MKHPNSWTPWGVVKGAFESVGNVAPHLTRNTCHANVLIGAVASTIHAMLCALLSNLVSRIERKGKLGFLMINRAWDGTPHECEFVLARSRSGHMQACGWAHGEAVQ